MDATRGRNSGNSGLKSADCTSIHLSNVLTVLRTKKKLKKKRKEIR